MARRTQKIFKICAKSRTLLPTGAQNMKNACAFMIYFSYLNNMGKFHNSVPTSKNTKILYTINFAEKTYNQRLAKNVTEKIVKKRNDSQTE